MLPTALRALVASTDYPPVEPVQLQSPSVRVALTVETVSPTPFALLRRAKNFQYRDDDLPLRIFRLNDPIDGLSEECKRVLNAISNENHSPISALLSSTVKEREPSWSKFQDMGFTGLIEEEPEKEPEMVVDDETRLPRSMTANSNATNEEMGMEIARPTTPSWADFMVAGFSERDNAKAAPAPLLLPPDKILPPIDSGFRVQTSQSTRRIEESLDRGDLTGVHPLTIDDAFWWVWISSLAGEEAAARKAVFGRCALAETVVDGGKWLVVEEKVKGAAPGDADALAAKKDKKRSKRSRLTRRKSVSSKPENEAPKLPPLDKAFGSRTTLGPDQRARIESAARSLRERNEKPKVEQPARSNTLHSRTPTMSTMMQPDMSGEAASALKWASKYDRDAIREQYLKTGPQTQKPTTPNNGAPPPPPKADTPKLVTNIQVPTQAVRKTEPNSPLPPTPREAPKSMLDIGDEPPATPAKNKPAAALPPVTPKQEPKPAAALPPVSPQSIQSHASARSSIDAIGKPKKDAKQSRFRKLFGGGSKSGKPGSRSTTPLPDDIPAGKMSTDIPPPQEPTRKLSMARKLADENTNGSTSVLVAVPKVEEPVAPKAPAQNNTERPPISREVSSSVNSEDQRAAEVTFSSFSGGPLLDQPAFVPDDSPAISVDDDYRGDKRHSTVSEPDDVPISPVSIRSASASRTDLPPPVPIQPPQMRSTPPPGPGGMRGPGGLPMSNTRADLRVGGPNSSQPEIRNLQGPPPAMRGPQGPIPGQHPAIRGPGPNIPPQGMRGPPPPGAPAPGLRGPGLPSGPRQGPPPINPMAGAPGSGPYPGGPGPLRPAASPQGYPPAGTRVPPGPGMRQGPPVRGPGGPTDRPIPAPGSGYTGIPVRGPNDAPSNSQVPPAQDRWAQIRENAARRARENASKAEQEKSSASGGENTNGAARPESTDGETSGEETIESRVARIKARVAELTGNMEGGAGAPKA